ncbi:TniQ family protein [Moritella sp. 24]|uniref:TniQ family protein n=1 Tax=Moritella sp. 24 TaxID=2746230 RepID=UPI001BA9909C|nr:TniQ family protein [Moritella sp. 24]QUM76171.1 TniQ family protein [Moritella sp. 24]
MFRQRPAPHHDESLESFVIRIANKNGYDDVTRFLMAVKRLLQNIDTYKFQTFPTNISLLNPFSSKAHSTARTAALHKLGSLTFNEPVELLGIAINRTSIAYSPSTTGLIRGSEVIPRSLLRKGNIPCCPVCLHENGYASYYWHFTAYEACHTHNVSLIDKCTCGANYDYRKDGLSGVCNQCCEPLEINQLDPSDNFIMISKWLTGGINPPLPNIPISYRWGLLHWWEKNPELKIKLNDFVHLWHEWPLAFHIHINDKITFSIEHAVVSKSELRVKDVFDTLLFNAIRLPDRSLRHNLILRELVQFIDDHLWEQDGLIANLHMNAIEISVFLNCTLEQVASMVEQRLIKPFKRVKPGSPLNVTDYQFYLGDVFCLWLAEFQTDEFNRSFYVSRC